MKKLNSFQLENSVKKNRKILLVSLIFLVLTMTLIGLGVKNQNTEIPNPIGMDNLRFEETSDENIHVYVDVSTKPYLFAVYESDGISDDSKFYLVMDSNNYLYVLYMSSNDYKKLNIDSIEETPIRVTGITKVIKSDIKQLAIEAYNKEMGSDYLNDDNFKEYVGLIYLDMESDINDSTIYYVVSFISFIFFFVFIIVYLNVYFKNQKIFKKFTKEELESIGAEIYSQKDTNPYEKMKLYLLKDYVVDTSNGIVILKYNDVVWAYPYEYRYNGLVVNKNIKAYDKNNKVHEFANTKFLDKNKDQTLQEVMHKLKEKNSEIVLGFNKENKKIVKEKMKKQKQY